MARRDGWTVRSPPSLAGDPARRQECDCGSEAASPDRALAAHPKGANHDDAC